jgi:hypothetical protein
MKCKNVALIILIFICPLVLKGQSFSEKRIFSKRIPAKKDMTLEINNKYGTVHITSWKVDSVSVRAEVEAFAPNESRLGKMLEGITVDISETNWLIRARTEFTQSINMIFESFKGMTKKLIPYESRVQINYFINAPDYINLNIENKYGDVYMESNIASTSVRVSNGSFKANSLNKAPDLTLTFCDATINKITEGTIDASFSEIVIGESDFLKINSISSRYDLKYNETINTDSKRDKFFIGTNGSIKGTSYFTDFRIEKLKNALDLETKYGSISADNVERSINNIVINSGYTDINLSFDPSVSYNLDIRYVNAFISLPDKNARLEKKSIDEEKKEFLTFGTVGKSPGNIKVRIDATRGNIYLK